MFRSLLLLLSATACVNMSSLQTAKALPQGQGRGVVGVGHYESPSLAFRDEIGTLNELSLRYFEVGYRHGIHDGLELGAKFTIIGSLALDVKYQLIDAGRIAVAAGLGAGYLNLSSEKINANGERVEDENVFVDAFVPLYASFEIEYFALYASPKYMARFVDGDASHMGGATVGLRVGGRVGAFVETTYMRDLYTDFEARQVNAAFYFDVSTPRDSVSHQSREERDVRRRRRDREIEEEQSSDPPEL
jgi:hypothetical protein